MNWSREYQSKVMVITASKIAEPQCAYDPTSILIIIMTNRYQRTNIPSCATSLNNMDRRGAVKEFEGQRYVI